MRVSTRILEAVSANREGVTHLCICICICRIIRLIISTQSSGSSIVPNCLYHIALVPCRHSCVTAPKPRLASAARHTPCAMPPPLHIPTRLTAAVGGRVRSGSVGYVTIDLCNTLKTMCTPPTSVHRLPHFAGVGRSPIAFGTHVHALLSKCLQVRQRVNQPVRSTLLGRFDQLGERSI